MQSTALVVSALLWCVWCSGCLTLALPRGMSIQRKGNEFINKEVANNEPSCEELKAMWRFSKRQSRTGKLANRLPFYRNMHSSYADADIVQTYQPTSRSIGGMRIGSIRNRPTIFGRIIHDAPLLQIRDPQERNSAFGELVKISSESVEPKPRAMTAFRIPGGGYIPPTGALDRLRAIARGSRARELQEQRMIEEMAAGAQGVDELNDVNRGQSGNFDDISYSYKPVKHQEKDSGNKGGAFPNLLESSVFLDTDGRYKKAYAYSRQRPNSHTASYYDEGYFNNEVDSLRL